MATKAAKPAAHTEQVEQDPPVENAGQTFIQNGLAKIDQVILHETQFAAGGEPVRHADLLSFARQVRAAFNALLGHMVDPSPLEAPEPRVDDDQLPAEPAAQETSAEAGA